MRFLILDIDTLRPDHLGCYGYGRETSPVIDSIAEEGMRFDSYYCPNAPCLPSRASLVTGQFGIRTGVVGHGGTAADLRHEGFSRRFRSKYSHNSLFNLFRRKGIYTASVSTFAERHSSWWFNAGLNEVINLGLGGGETGEMVTDTALSWLDRHEKDDNWLLHLNYWDPHTPYRTPMSIGRPFEDVPLPQDWIDEEVFARHKNHVGPHCANEIGMWDDSHPKNCPRHPGKIDDLDGVKRFIDDYDTGILYADMQIGKVVEHIKKAGVWEDTAVIVTADHGENMGELGLYAEHGTADEITCRIPMIIKWPGMKTGVEKSFHTNVDLAPTLAELFSLEPVGGYEYDGVSFAPALRGEAYEEQDGVVLTQCAHVCQRSARWDDWLYIRTVHGGYHLFPEQMLFNIKDDPHETNDLADKYSEICAEGARRILVWEQKMLTRSAYDYGYQGDPMYTVLAEGGPEHCRGELLGYMQRLRETGREWGVKELERIYARDLKRELNNKSI
ncbi:MAG: sulfatase [Eubacteriales bacterium]|jgi:choline-sulfatase